MSENKPLDREKVLAQLRELHAAGILSDSQYNAKIKKVDAPVKAAKVSDYLPIKSAKGLSITVSLNGRTYPVVFDRAMVRFQKQGHKLQLLEIGRLGDKTVNPSTLDIALRKDEKIVMSTGNAGTDWKDLEVAQV